MRYAWLVVLSFGLAGVAGAQNATPESAQSQPAAPKPAIPYGFPNSPLFSNPFGGGPLPVPPHAFPNPAPVVVRPGPKQCSVPLLPMTPPKGGDPGIASVPQTPVEPMPQANVPAPSCEAPKQ